MNLLSCTAKAGADRIEIFLGDQSVELPWHYTNTHDLPESGLDVVVGVRPEDVIIADASSPNTLTTRVERCEALGSEILVHLSHSASNVDPARTVDARGENGAPRQRQSRRCSLGTDLARAGPLL